MYRFWLIFAQTATVLLAIFFVISTLRPELLPWKPRGEIVTIREVAPVVEENRPDSYAKAAEIAMPSVVNIFTSKEVKEPAHPFMDDPVFRRFFGEQFESRPRRASSLGSGVIVSANGYILTNHHVIEAADEVEVALLDGRKAKAKLIGSDPETDLAVLKTNLTDLPVITFGQSQQVKVGDVVLAVGNPFGVGQSVTMGIVSALSRSRVGINTAIYSRSGGSLGIGFAIPVHIAKQIMEQIVQTGSVIRGWLGVSMQDMTLELAESFGLEEPNGALIASVLKDGPADKAGIKTGDILIGIAGKPLKNSAEMLNVVAALPPGETVAVTVIRNKREKSIPVKLGVRPKQK